MKNFLVLLLLVGCKPPTPAQEVLILKAELKISKAKCAVYSIDPKYPRDAEVTGECSKFFKP